MESWQVALISSLLTFLGTIVVAWIGYRRVTQKDKNEFRRNFAIDRVAAHRELWGLLEDIHVKIRLAEPDDTDLKAFAQALNAFRMRNGLYLEKKVLQASMDYYDAVVELYRMISDQGSEEDLEAFSATMAIPAEAIEAVEVLSTLQEKMTAKRNSLVALVKEALNEPAP